MVRALIILFMLVPVAVDAARLSYESEPRGDGYAVRVFLDSEGETLNVIEGTLVLEDAHSVETGGSIIGLWISEPQIDGSNVEFAGMIPGGFHGALTPSRGLTEKALLVTVLFDAPPRDVSADVRAYLHDGEGTRITVKSDRYIAGGGVVEEPDVSPPESVRVEIVPATGDTPALLVAYGTDTGRGVSRYEVSFGDDAWSAFTSPREVSEEERSQRVRVRIFDHDGNFREVLVQEGRLARIGLELIAAVLLFVALIILIYLWKRKKRRRSYSSGPR